MKGWNEITVMLKMEKAEAINRLREMGYHHEVTYLIHDYYYLPQDTDLNVDILQLLNKMVLIRKFNELVRLTIKHKEYAPDGSITSQSNIDLPVQSFEEAKAFLEALGYKEVMQILDEATIMKRDGLGFVIENVNNGSWLMLEIEENEQYPKIVDLKKKLKESGLLYDDSDYYVKNAKLVYETTVIPD